MMINHDDHDDDDNNDDDDKSFCLLNIGEKTKEKGSKWANEAAHHKHWEQS